MKPLTDSAGLRADGLLPDHGPARGISAGGGGIVHVEDAGLIFRGDYVRDGADLVISGEGQRLVVHDYFTAAHRPKLVAPNGASLADSVIDALARPAHGTQVAQAGAPTASDASAAIGRVQSVAGTASVVRNGVTVAVHTGDLVYKGDVVQTDRASSLSVSFLDGTVFSVASSARMVLNDMIYRDGDADNHSLFNLVQGSISFVAGKVAKTGDMKVGTPVATMGIRGTAVKATIEADDGTSRLSVITEPPSPEHPNGHTGRFDVYDSTDPAVLLGTVDDPTQVLVVHPRGSGIVRTETLAKSPAEIGGEQQLVQSLYQTLSESPRLPVFNGPATGGGTSSGTAPNQILPNPQAPLPGEPGGAGTQAPGPVGPGAPGPNGIQAPGSAPEPGASAPEAPRTDTPTDGAPPLSAGLTIAVPVQQASTGSAAPSGALPAVQITAAVTVAPTVPGPVAPAVEAAHTESGTSPVRIDLEIGATPDAPEADEPAPPAVPVVAAPPSGTPTAPAPTPVPVPVPAAGITGRVVDGYVSGALVFADANGNRTLDPGEASTRSGADGGFRLVGGSGPVVAVGGIDTSTGLPNLLTLTAPVGAIVVTPLTTLVQGMGGSAAAGAQVAAAFGLSGIDLSSFDPYAAAASGTAAGRSAYLGSIAVADTALLLATALVGQGVGADAAYAAILGRIAAAIGAPGAPAVLNLGDPVAVRGLLTGAASALHVSLTQTAIDAAVGGATTLATHLDAITATGQPLLTQVAATEVLARAQADALTSQLAPPSIGATAALSLDAQGVGYLSATNLRASDPNGGARPVTYTVVGDAHGSFAVGAGGSTTHFTQADLDSGRVVYRHAGGAPAGGTETLTFLVTTAGGGSSTVALAVAAPHVNHAPVVEALPGDSAGTATPLAARTAGDRTSLTATGTLTVTDADPNDRLTLATTLAGHSGPTGGLSDAQLAGLFHADLASGPGGSSAHDLTWTFDSAGQGFQYLSQGETLTLGYGVRATDDSGAANNVGDGVVTVRIAGTNSAPVLNAGANGLGTERAGQTGAAGLTDTAGGTLSFTDANWGDRHGVGPTPTMDASSVRWLRADGTDAGPPSAAVTAALAGASHAAVTADSSGGTTGQVSWHVSLPDSTLDVLGAGETLRARYVVTIDDGHGARSYRPVTAIFTGVDDAPVAQDASVQVSGTRPVTGQLTATDVDSPSLTYATASGPAHGSLSLGAGGQFTYTANPGYHGDDSFTYRASDGTLASNVATVTLHGTDAPPTIVSGAGASVALTAAPVGTLAPQTALAQSYLTAGNSLVNGLGGAAGFGETALPVGDDSPNATVDLTGVFGPQGLNFFGRAYTTLYVNNNGNLTFGSPSGTFVPSQITGSTAAIIAPFFADVDTGGGAAGATPGGHSTGSNRVYVDQDATNGVLTVTWDDVGYYSRHTDRLDAFQVQLVGLGGGDFDIVYRYEAVAWTLGDASGAVNAVAGYAAGDGVHYAQLSQSGDAAQLRALPTTTGNTGLPGVYLFQASNGTVSANAALTATGTIGFTDADAGDRHTASAGLDHVSATTSSGAAIPAGTQAALRSALSAQVTQDGDANGGSAGTVTWTFALPNGAAAFLHRGETLSATYTVSVGDGTAAATPTSVTVTVTGVDDPPNAGGDHAIHVASGGIAVVHTADLGATDPDDTPDHLTYTVSGAPQGTFTLSGDGTPATAVTSFTQADVDAGRVVYHAGSGSGAAQAQDVVFVLTDALGARTTVDLAITVDANHAPTVASARPIAAVPGDGTVAGTANLSASDPEQASAALTDHVTDSAGGAFTLGRATLDAFTQSDIVFDFTQADVDAGAVVHHRDANAPAGSAEAIAFVVSDGAGGSIDGTVGLRTPLEQRAASGGIQAAPPTRTGDLTQRQLDVAVVAALAEWAAAGASAAQIAALAAVTYSVMDLPGTALGEAGAGHVAIDANAGGYGWYLDPVPGGNAAFPHAANAEGSDRFADPSQPSAGHIDLLTTVAHEMGHILGLPDGPGSGTGGDLMSASLVTGERRLPTPADLAATSQSAAPGHPTVAGPGAAGSGHAGASAAEAARANHAPEPHGRGPEPTGSTAAASAPPAAEPAAQASSDPSHASLPPPAPMANDPTPTPAVQPASPAASAATGTVQPAAAATAGHGATGAEAGSAASHEPGAHAAGTEAAHAAPPTTGAGPTSAPETHAAAPSGSGQPASSEPAATHTASAQVASAQVSSAQVASAQTGAPAASQPSATQAEHATGEHAGPASSPAPASQTAAQAAQPSTQGEHATSGHDAFVFTQSAPASTSSGTQAGPSSVLPPASDPAAQTPAAHADPVDPHIDHPVTALWDTHIAQVAAHANHP